MAPEVDEPDSSEPVPWQQRFLDSPYLLLLLGVGVTVLFYTLWGLLEMRLMPTAPLP
jgi:hypothetical protein